MDTNSKLSAGEKIRIARRLENFTIGLLSKTTGISEGKLTLIENGIEKPLLGDIVRISKVLRININDLVDTMDVSFSSSETSCVEPMVFTDYSDERHLVEIFRQLTPQYKEVAIAMMHKLVDMQCGNKPDLTELEDKYFGKGE